MCDDDEQQEDGHGVSAPSIDVRCNSAGADATAAVAEAAPVLAEPRQPGATRWNKFQADDGRGSWWWREADGAWFLESQPGAWQRFSDPASGRRYWFKDDAEWFWENSGVN